MGSTSEDRTAAITDKLAEVVRRIVEVARPDRIILFGSAARGTAGPDSDLDLLVVKSGVAHRRRLAQDIYMNPLGRHRTLPRRQRGRRRAGLPRGPGRRRANGRLGRSTRCGTAVNRATARARENGWTTTT